MAQTDEAKLHFLDYWRVIRVRWMLILLAFLLVLVTAAVVTYFQPREYQSSAFIEVVPLRKIRTFLDRGWIQTNRCTIPPWRPPFTKLSSAPVSFIR